VTEISRTALFGKLNSLLYQSIESATVFCKMRGNPYVELVHWLQQILQLQDSDLRRILDHYGIENARLAADFTKALDALPRGASSISDLSSHLEEAVERAWVYGSLMYQSSQVRGGYLAIGILKTRALKNELLNISREFERINLDDLTKSIHKIIDGSPEDALAPTDGSALAEATAGGAAAGEAVPGGKQSALARFAVDLTEQARNGELDPIVGRDEEIRQIIDILMRRRQNNPILTGEAGVGKTAVVEGFAMRLAKGDVPPQLKNVALMVLDLGLLQAGASMKGEFEQRLRQVIDEVQASATPIILFIDEAHTLIGAGGAEGTGDAANLLKPALARGTLRTVAATTWAEYKKYIEKDPALTRRFQVVKVDEPSEDKCIRMLRCVAPVMEAHHKVQVFDEAVEASSRLSHRYIPGRQLPDKAVSLLDTACARVAVALHSTPAPLEYSGHRIDSLELEQRILAREEAIGVVDEERATGVEADLTEEQARHADLTERWEKEKTLVDEILELRRKLRGDLLDEEKSEGVSDAAADELAEESTADTAEVPPAADEAEDEGAVVPADSGEDGPGDEPDEDAIRQRLEELQKELAEMQGDKPLVHHSVDGQAVASVVEDWTGVPVGSMVKDEIENVLSMAERMGERVIGQDHALEMIAKRVQTSRANLDNPGKPIGVFMLCGPSGVGKTETALALAEMMYGGEQNLITINMSEFQEAHTVSTLKGAPPGYVGYGEGGVLTEAVRRRPYSVVLLDEIEKAHPDVHEIFFQVFDKGFMEDGEGRLIDFKNTLILLTSNVGSELIMNLSKDPDLMPDAEGIAKALREPQLKIFPAALLGRMVSIPFYPLSDEVLHKIIVLQLERIRKRMDKNHNIPLTYSDAVLELISARCTELESGGRMIDTILTNTVLPTISRELLTRLSQGNPLSSVEIDAKDDDFSYTYG
jgi:type VI secretion system protein VasG